MLSLSKLLAACTLAKQRTPLQCASVTRLQIAAALKTLDEHLLGVLCMAFI